MSRRTARPDSLWLLRALGLAVVLGVVGVLPSVAVWLVEAVGR